MKTQSERIPDLAGIKLFHTSIWLFFAGCIVAIPFAGAQRQFRLASVLTGLVLVECAVLAMNRGRCPLTDLAGRYTIARTTLTSTCRFGWPDATRRSLGRFSPLANCSCSGGGLFPSGDATSQKWLDLGLWR